MKVFVHRSNRLYRFRSHSRNSSTPDIKCSALPARMQAPNP